MSNSGFVVSGEQGPRLFQLHAVKGALKLEKLGMRHSKVGSVRKAWALHFGMKANSKIDDVIARVEQEIEKIKAEGNFTVEKI